MSFWRKRHGVLAAASVGVLLASLGVSAVGTASTASATTGDKGGCPNHRINVHTSDPPRHHGWACWIDDGDNLRVCDSHTGDGAYVYATLHSDIGAWYKLAAADEGHDPGCETVGDDVDIEFARLRIQICAVHNHHPNSRFDCKKVIWPETD